ncbi:hypothetical protein BCD_1003 (plasmid) [Borrelia crocidurae DOU]|uniref:Uncharacterized protein n=1 Tax=Borrelia crocidurae DOU TaxID=1293575 RepID=W5SIU6_9SPIR|nr:hypothetical protein BCD_1003 [Borrelia crocidurae DOU]
MKKKMKAEKSGVKRGKRIVIDLLLLMIMIGCLVH